MDDAYRLIRSFTIEMLALREYLDYRLDRIEAALKTVVRKEAQIMALGQDIIDAVTAETTVIDSFIALVQGWIAAGTVTAAEGARILADINNNKTKLETAILANTPPPTP